MYLSSRVGCVRIVVSTSNPYAFRLDVEYSVPYPTASGRYYWTNTYYWRGPAPTPLSPADTNNARLLALNSVSQGVTVELTRITSAFGTGTYFQQIAVPVSGNCPGEDRTLVGVAARLLAQPGGSMLWWRPLRGILRGSDVVGGVLSVDVRDWLVGEVLPRISNMQQLVNYRDVPVAGVAVDSVVHTWQTRRGSKRAARHVLAY